MNNYHLDMRLFLFPFYLSIKKIPRFELKFFIFRLEFLISEGRLFFSAIDFDSLKFLVLLKKQNLLLYKGEY